MKRILLATILCTMSVFMLAGCGKKTSEENNTEASIENPMKEVDKEEQLEASGIDIDAPKEAENVRRIIVENPDGTYLAEVNFIYKDHSYYYRVASTNVTDISDDDMINMSGLYYDFADPVESKVCDRDAKVYLADQAGYIAWVDVVPGYLYNLCSAENTDADTLTELANSIFVSMQGEAE